MRFLIAFALMCSTAFAQKAVITGPTKVPAGEMIVLDSKESDADSRHWMLANSDKQFLSFDKEGVVNRSVVTFTSQPCVLTFFLSVAKNVDGVAKIDVARIDIMVGNPPGPGPGPGPQPRPEPDNPEPDVPEPDPVDPEPDLEGLALDAYKKVKQIDKKPGEAKAIGEQMQAMAGRAAGLGWTGNDLKVRFAAWGRDNTFKNQEARNRWQTFSSWLGTVLSADQNDLDSVIDAFIQVGEGLIESEQAGSVPQRRFPARPARKEPTIKEMIGTIRSDLQNVQQEIGP